MAILDNLVLALMMSEDTTAARADSSGNGHSFTASGSISRVAGPASGMYAARHSPAGAYLYHADHADFSLNTGVDFTVVYFLSMSGTVENLSIPFAKYDWGSADREYQFSFRSAGKTPTLWVAEYGETDPADINTGFPSATGVWNMHALAVGADHNTYYSYDGANWTAGAARTDRNGGSVLRLGRNSNETSVATLDIAMFCIWRRKLTNAELFFLYNGGFPTPYPWVRGGSQVIMIAFRRWQNFLRDLRLGLVPPDMLRRTYGDLVQI